MEKEEISIYVDGGYRIQDSLGAYAGIILMSKDDIREYSCSVPNSTSNRMEILAVIEGLRYLKKILKGEDLREFLINIYTDSTYVKNGATIWKNGWLKKNFKDVKNRDLWEQLYTVQNNFNHRYHWVKAHSGNQMNEYVDTLCNKAMDKVLGITHAQSDYKLIKKEDVSPSSKKEKKLTELTKTVPEISSKQEFKYFTFRPRSFEEERIIDTAYIIAINHPVSKELARRCKESCRNVGMNTTYWEGVDGTGNDIKIPNSLNWIPWHLIRIPSNVYSNSQIACFLSHFSLWMQCVQIGKPIAILEHDSLMVKKIEYAKYYNAIQFLGCVEQVNGSMPVVPGIPPHASIYGGTWRAICRAHAYVIDPPVARLLIAEVVRLGMVKTLDIFIRADIFSIVQDDVYAYDLRGESTIRELGGNEIDA